MVGASFSFLLLHHVASHSCFLWLLQHCQTCWRGVIYFLFSVWHVPHWITYSILTLSHLHARWVVFLFRFWNKYSKPLTVAGTRWSGKKEKGRDEEIDKTVSEEWPLRIDGSGYSSSERRYFGPGELPSLDPAARQSKKQKRAASARLFTLLHASAHVCTAVVVWLMILNDSGWMLASPFHLGTRLEEELSSLRLAVLPLCLNPWSPSSRGRESGRVREIKGRNSHHLIRPSPR